MCRTYVCPCSGIEFRNGRIALGAQLFSPISSIDGVGQGLIHDYYSHEHSHLYLMVSWNVSDFLEVPNEIAYHNVLHD